MTNETVVFDLPNGMQITIGTISRRIDHSDSRMAVWYEEKPYDSAAGAAEISDTPLGEFLLKHVDEL